MQLQVYYIPGVVHFTVDCSLTELTTQLTMTEVIQRIGQLCCKIWTWIKFLIGVLQQIPKKNRMQ